MLSNSMTCVTACEICPKLTIKSLMLNIMPFKQHPLKILNYGRKFQQKQKIPNTLGNLRCKSRVRFPKTYLANKKNQNKSRGDTNRNHFGNMRANLLNVLSLKYINSFMTEVPII